MAKKGMRPETKAQKLKNNKVGKLPCSVKDCEDEFFIATFNSLGSARRVCHYHYENPPENENTGENTKAKKDKRMLQALGLAA